MHQTCYKMYLILSDADGNATPEVFHDGVDVIGLRAAGECPTEKILRKRSNGEDPLETMVIGKEGKDGSL